MASSIPALGYPSRTDAVLALRKEGLLPLEIAARIGISRTQVSALEASARRRTARVRDVAHGPSIAIAKLFPCEEKRLLRAHAARRGITVNRLIQIIVETVVEDDMIDAVLDDAGDLGRWTS